MLIAYVVRVIRKHPLRLSVGGDAHAVKRSGTSTLGVHRPAVFASYSGRTESRPYARSDVPCERPLPLPLGEVAERSEDGEGKP